MQELMKKPAAAQVGVKERIVRIFLQTSFYTVSGSWQWNLATDAVFCSDVILTFPQEFAGTRTIFHPDDVAAVKEKLFPGITIPHLAFRIITTYGEVKNIEGTNVFVHAEKGDKGAFQRQAMTASLQEKTAKVAGSHLRLLGEIAEKTEHFSGIGTWYFNAATHQTWYSDNVFRLHGLPAQSLNSHLNTFHPFIHPEDRELVVEYTDMAVRKKVPLHLSYRLQLAGEVKWLSYKTQWLYSEKGEPVLGGVFQDITEQKTAGKDIADAKSLVLFQRQQVLNDEQQVGFGHWQVNLLTRKTTCSDQYYRLFGLKPQTPDPSLNWFLNYIHPDDRHRVEAAYRKIISDQNLPDLEFRILRSDGRMRYVLQKAKLLMLDQEMILSGVLQDITVQRMLEKKLAGLQHDLQLKTWLLQQNEAIGNTISWIMDLEESTIDWSESFYKLVGFAKAQPLQITEQSLFALVHPHDASEFRQNWNNAVQTKQEHSFAFRMLQRGSVHFMRADFRFQRLHEKAFFLGTLQDTTGQEVLQQQLSQRVQLAECLTENIADRVMITDNNNTILLWNTASEKAYGIRKAEAVGENFFDIFPHFRSEANRQLFQQVMEGERVVLQEQLSVTGNGYYNLYLVPLFTDNEVTGILHVVHNVTGEVELRKNLNDRLQLIESIVQSSVDRIIALDRNLNYLYWNKKAEEYYGLSKEEVIGRNILEVFPQLVNDPSYGEIRRALRGETVHIPVNLEQKKYFETYLVPIKTTQGEVTSLLWMAHDRTSEMQAQAEQHRAQQELREEHRRLKEAQAIGHVGSFEWSATEDVIFWSDEMYRIHGLKPQRQAMNMEKVVALVHPDDRDYFTENVRQCRTMPMTRSFTHRIVKADGGIRTVTRRIQSFGDEEGTVTHLSGTLQDITEQKAAEKQIREQTHFLHRVLETSPDMVSIMDLPSKKVQYLNEETFAAHGFSPKQMLTKSREELVNIIHEEDRPVLATYYESLAVASDDETVTAKYRAKNSRGQWKWFLVRGRVFQRDEHGTVTQILNVIEDITQREQAQLELIRLKEQLAQKATDKYLTLFNSIDEGFYLLEVEFDENGKAVDFLYHEENPAAVRIMATSMRGKRISEFSTGYEPYWFDIFGSVALTGESQRLERYAAPNQKWFSFYVTKIGDEKSRQIALIFQDITDRKQAEEALRESEERKAFLLKLNDVLGPLTDIAAIQYTACELLAQTLGVSRVHYGEVTDDDQHIVVKTGYAAADEMKISGTFHMESFGPQIISELRKGKALIVENIRDKTDLTAEEKANYAALSLESFAVFSLVKNNRFSATLNIHNNTPRRWREGELFIMKETAERIWTAVQRARAEAGLKEFTLKLEQQVEERTADLQESKEILQSVFDASLHAIILFEAVRNDRGTITDYKVLLNNAVTIKWNGRSLVGKLYGEEFPHIREYGIFNAYNKVMETGEPMAMEVLYEGEGFRNWFTISAVRYGENKLVATAEDITERKKAEEEVQKNLTVLKQAEDIAAIGSWEYHVSTRRFNWSDGMYRLFDLPVGSRVQPDIYLHHALEEDRSVAKRIIKNLQKLHQSFEEQIRIKTGNGVHDLKVKATAIADENGTVQRIVGVDMDLTDIVQAQEQLERSRYWLEETAKASPDAITIYDLQKKEPVYLNNCLAEWTGKTPEELVAMGIEGRLQLIHVDDRLRVLHFNEKIKAASDGKLLTIEYRIYGREEKMLWIHNRSKVFQRDASGTVTHILSVLQDVTESKAADRMQKVLNASLEQKNQELKTANEEITSFAFVASHDLKEPLRKMHTFGDWLLKNEHGLSADGKAALQKMNNSVQRLDLLTNDILTLTKVHVSNVAHKPIDLNAIMDLVKQDLRDLIEQSNALLDISLLPTIFGVASHLRHLFKNLVSNSIKFQQAGVQPKVFIKGEKGAVYLKISIADNGIGIAPEYHQRIFEMFRRLHGLTEYEGTGMGLAICKKIMEKHGGKITVDSNEGEGATFTCWFPLALLVS
ncbi:PAS domain S-box protein [Flavisolibacter sp. BT320]|nr:PAS domain S-box protein [Flavisolibacter longurius]